MAVVLLCLIIGHMVGDFYLQSSRLAEKKRTSFSVLFLHSGIYAACMFSILFICIKAQEIWFPFVILSVSHLIIDYLRARILEPRVKEPRKEMYLFLADQFIHITLIVSVVLIFSLGSHIGSLLSTFVGTYTYISIRKIVLIAFVYIASLNPTAVLVKEVLSGVVNGKDQNAGKESGKGIDGSGYLIGIFERIITITFVLIDQFAALGFVLAAKSVARFKKIEDEQGFAEKYLVGTLFSVTLALCSTMIIKLFI